LRYAIISDIHGNIQALEAVMATIERLNVDEILCLGDIVGYGAKPGECIAIARQTCSIVLLGNHDAAAVEKTSIDYFNPAAKLAIEWTVKRLATAENEYLGSLPLVKEYRDFQLTHATYSNPENWGYIFSTVDAAVEFESNDIGLLFYGHTHYPGIFSQESQQVNYQQVREMTFSEDRRYIVNVGSVGQPRDGNPDACFVIYDQKVRMIRYCRVPYDIKGTQQDILETDIPRELAMRLSIGR
jgi:diadenosine tetraphosphatase ApaH/serine/threonine PP2A family protein phosphatase